MGNNNNIVCKDLAELKAVLKEVFVEFSNTVEKGASLYYKIPMIPNHGEYPITINKDDVRIALVYENNRIKNAPQKKENLTQMGVSERNAFLEHFYERYCINGKGSIEKPRLIYVNIEYRYNVVQKVKKDIKLEKKWWKVDGMVLIEDKEALADYAKFYARKTTNTENTVDIEVLFNGRVPVKYPTLINGKLTLESVELLSDNTIAPNGRVRLGEIVYCHIPNLKHCLEKHMSEK